ncbi:uncharacterized protein LOC124131838 [Haliotis rufescens]|uniref:uncharacterized protein LOC124131838 n=1 Tax=Haliotis rufescens TaxID=6454 RepID=UPI00201F7276|nr:uncharacterized protein LOC124131838 [Haliotis rufescens]
MDGYRHISCVEKVNNLRTFIKDDLLNCGVKLPKNKKAKKLNNSRGPSQDGILVPSGIFGNYLAHVPCEYVTDCGYVPKFLVDSAEHIKIHFKTEGIFRKSGSVSRQKELKQQIEEGVNMDVSSIYDLTTLIKQFFRELPEPLFTSLYHDTFIKCYQLDNTKSVTEAIHALCLLLPAEHLSTLRFIMQLLNFIASHSDDNKMDAANLAVVLAPNIMHVNSKSEKMNSTEEKLLQIQTAIVELLIKDAEKVGMVSSSLYQRTTLMTECFGVQTDDELDASDDNTLEDSKDMKKKKKRKRSGSLQGIVSSIANGLAKLRRSTDGKNGNSSQNMTTASNESAQSLSGSLEHTHYPTTTPVVIRKRKASGEVIPFSASKKKAILQHLPQGSALGHTPFTPASAIRKMDINDPRRGGVLDTPSLSFGDKQHMPFTATPSHNIKTPRKKLNLFSPSSSKKKMARSPSFSNISTGSTKKSGRGKNIFRRLSGSKADKSSASDSSLHIGERLASPTKKDEAMDATSMRRSQSESDSPISALAQSTTYMPDASVVSHMDIKQTLNEGFINESHLDLDHTDAGSGLQRSHSLYRPVHASASDPVVAGRNTEGNSHKRSLSAEGMNLRRGQPNTIHNGLLKGQQNQLKKLRKSFDKSDISGPIPIIVPAIGDGTESKQRMEGEKIQKVPPLPPLSAPNQNSSLMNVVLPPPDGFNDTIQQTGYDSDESEAGFSTISGDTVIYIPKQSSSSTSLQSNKSQGSHRGQGRMSAQTSRESIKKSLQTSNSSDSLLSSGSEMSVESNTSKLERCLSTDSGKGSLFDETLIQPPAHEPKDSLDVAFVADESMLLDTTIMRKSEYMDSDTAKPSDQAHPHQPVVKKSHSAQQLALPPRTGVVRSQSMYSHQEARKHNIKPNLLISAETHKILSRAGYFPDKAPQPSGKDFRLPVKSPPRSHSFNVSRRNTTLADQSMLDESQVCSKSVHELQDISQRSYCETPKRHNVSETSRRPQSCEISGISNNGRIQPGTQKMELVPEGHTLLPQIKRAEMPLPKHESVTQMHASNAGKVAENVKQFTDVVEKQLLSGPMCAPKQRGMSPVRIPTIFAKNNDMSARYRDMAQAAIERGRLASDDRLSNKSDVTSQSCVMNGSLSSISTLTDSETDIFKHPASVSTGKTLTVKSEVSMSVTSPDDSVNITTDIGSRVSFEGQQVDLSCSLLDTINDICTPKIQRKTSSRSPLKDCGNNMSGQSPTKPMEITDHVVLRTASGMTPRQVLRFSQPSRSTSKTVPNKPVKRLSSPGQTLRNSRSPNKQSSTSLPDNSAQAM